MFFFASWCSHSVKQDLIFKSNEEKCLLPITKIDVDKDVNNYAYDYNITNVPTMLLIDSNKRTEIHRWVGYTPIQDINEYLVGNGYANGKSKKDINYFVDRTINMLANIKDEKFSDRNRIDDIFQDILSTYGKDTKIELAKWFLKEDIKRGLNEFISTSLQKKPHADKKLLQNLYLIIYASKDHAKMRQDLDISKSEYDRMLNDIINEYNK